MNSMTGYGKGISEKDGRKITVELKSVNHRFLDLNVKMPKTFNFADDTLRKDIKDAVARGHIDVYVNYEDMRAERSELFVDYELAKKYYNAAKNLNAMLGIDNNVSTYELMRMPDVIVDKENEDSEEVLLELLKDGLSKAIGQLNAMRKREGELIRNDIVSRIDVIDKIVDDIAKISPEVIAEHKDKLRARLEESLEGVEVDEAKLLNELVFYVDKVGIDEELTRLKAHIKHFYDIMSKNEPVGRQIDFLVQEMNRETNTIGSKCNEINIANRVVMLKTEIEKVREQIQNIE